MLFVHSPTSSSDSSFPSPGPIPIQSLSKTGNLKPKQPIYLTVVSSSFVSSDPTEPLSVKEALQSPQWSQAMIEEYQALQN